MNVEYRTQTDLAKGFYEKIGFKENKDFFSQFPASGFSLLQI